VTGIPAVLVEAAELALADLRDADGPEVRLDLTAAADDAWHVDAVFAEHTIGFAVVVGPERSPALIVALADGLQQAFIEHLWAARPVCPLHEHPLSARELDGQACWTCPSTGGWSCPIGSYRQRAAYRGASPASGNPSG
jgi:hypothetical protein